MSGYNDEVVALSPAEKSEWINKLHDVSEQFLPATCYQGGDNSNKRVYVVSFDGTWNDRDNVTPGGIPTIPAQLEKELSSHYDGKHMAGHYYPGVGTQTSPLMANIDGATGRGAENIAEKAFSDYQKQAAEWHKEDPNAPIVVMVMGFSRGAASARHFMNLVDDRGIPSDGGKEIEHGDMFHPRQMHYDSYLAAPGSVHTTALLYDTVATGQEHNLNLGIPPSTDFVVHYTAADEQRITFPLTPISQPDFDPNHLRTLETSLPGAHSDIGGGYPDGVDKLSKWLGEVTLDKLGLPMKDPGPPPLDALDEGRHDSTWSVDKVALPIKEELFGPARLVERVPNEAMTPAETAAMEHHNEILKAAAMENGIGVTKYTVQLQGDGNGVVTLRSSHPNSVSLDGQTHDVSIEGQPAHQLTPAQVKTLLDGKDVTLQFDAGHALVGANDKLAPQNSVEPADQGQKADVQKAEGQKQDPQQPAPKQPSRETAGADMTM
ncbi:DUF2235 domain-containing protein [Paraburkholderia sp. UCT31]|uniref:phospholipase effector Tle1 domain-containing protein n=1 Tax=Paraburkholderia sp. UCT31 TaxID=2615209 RepID=UPI0016554156|nr:DUF2235 domain-containing protein [Paraburkholderia sp. UCT31]MBC8737187.1 DUF2235 domain-containing protein [Paraburkholderia sp. UCT31]